MRNIIALIIAFLISNIALGQENKTIISKNEIKIKYSNKLNYSVEYENADFKIYFTRKDLINLIDTFKTFDDNKYSSEIIKKYLKHSKDSLFFKDFVWFAFQKMNIIPTQVDNMLIYFSNLVIYYDFNCIVDRLLLNGNMRLFDKQLGKYLNVKEIDKVIESSYGETWCSVEENLMVGNKKLFNLRSIIAIE